MTEAHHHASVDAAALPKLNWLAVLGVMTAAALVLYLVTSTVSGRLEAGRAKPAAAVEPAH